MIKFLKRLGKNNEKKNETGNLGRAPEIDLADKMQSERGREGEKKSEGKLKDRGKFFVGGLNLETTSERLEAYFSHFGDVVDAVVMKFPDTSRSRGFGFVTFADSAVVDHLEGEIHTLDGNHVDVRRFTENGPARKNERRIFLGGVPFDVTRDKLSSFFSRYGEVVNVEIPRDRKTNKQKGYAFISFKEQNSAENCLADGFVHLGGKRVHIQKAVPKCRPTLDLPNSYAEGGEEGFVVDDLSDSVESATGEDDHSSASGDRLSVSGVTSGFQKLIQGYYMDIMALFKQTNEKKEEDRNWQPQENEIMEVEKLLAKALKGSEEDVLDFTSYKSNTDEDTTDNDQEGGDDDDDDDDDDYDYDIPNRNSSPFGNPLRSSPTFLDELSTSLAGTLVATSKKASTEEMSHVKSLSGKEFDCVDQSTSVPFKIADGLASCSLCRWKSQDSSAESFLHHYKTVAHQLKLKERFLPEQTTPIDNGLSRADKVEPKNQSKIQTDKNIKNRQPDRQPQREQVPQQQQRKMRQRQRKTNAPEKETEKRKNAGPKLENDCGNKISNLNIHTLAKGMLCIQPLPGEKFGCRICNKTIPKAADFSNLMKNLSFHLQSKKHLNKLLETENSLKSEMNNSNQKTGGKAAVKKVQNPEQKSIPKYGNPEMEKGNAADSGKGTTNKKKPEKSAAALQNTFLCLHCKFFTSDRNLFNVHLNSKSHLEAHKSEVGALTEYWENFDKCKSCDKYLYGSLYSINKHHSKCLRKKN